MSHYQNGQYPQYPHSQPPLPPLPPQSTGHQQQSPYDQNASQASPYPPNGMQYPDQQYSPQSNLGRHPSIASRQDAELFMGGAAPPPPPARYNSSASGYTPTQSSYNPQDYSSPSNAYPGGLSPQMGRRPSQHQSYNPADYVPGASPYNYSTGFSPVSQSSYAPSPSLNQSPGSQRQPMYSNSRPTVQTSYSSHYGTPGPPPLPAIPSAGDSPSADWGTVPSLGRYSTRRYGQTSQQPLHSPPMPSPPPNPHSRTSSTGMSPLTSPGHPPPPPPHHTGSLGRTESLAHRPLPNLPPGSSTGDEYFSPASGSKYQTDLENQIVNLANGAYDDSEDDPEALAGLLAFQEAERQEAEDAARRASSASTLFVGDRTTSVRVANNNEYVGSDSDVPPVDLSMMGGGWDAHMSYGADPNSLSVARHESTHGRSQSQTVSSSGSFRRSAEASDADPHYSYGTGGLYDPDSIDPKARRMSFDEDDEITLLGEPPEMFYHPGITNRPLPQLPSDALNRAHSASSAPYPDSGTYVPFPRHPSYPTTSQSHIQSPPPGRHTSLVAHSSTPPALTPTRAITDADIRKRIRQMGGDSTATSTTGGASAVALGLPELTKRYNPSTLRTRDFDLCAEPWAMSMLAKWLSRLAEDEQYLKKQPLVDGLVALFTHKVPTMNIADAETLADRVIDDMMSNGTIIQEEEWLNFKDEPISGVLYQLTGIGCYAPSLHSHEQSTRCYSYHCQRTEKKIDLSTQADDFIEKDWVEYWEIKKEDLEKFDRKEVARQNILHEIVQKEENYLRELGVLLELFRDNLAKQDPPVIPPKKLPAFLKDVFGKAEAIKRVNEEHLLPQMKYQQQNQGPWIAGFSGIFREWIRKAKTAYIDYAAAYPQAVSKVRHELERNMLFKNFLSACQADKRSRRLDYNHYLKLPLTRLQQVILLLDSALGKSLIDNEEKRNLQLAIDEIRVVTHECDARVGEGGKKVQLVDLQAKLKLREEIKKQVNLHLDHLGRELIHEGDLLRMGSGVIGGIARFNWLETHAILFDHFLVLAKSSSGKDGYVRPDQYDVSRFPIPMDLLVLESDNEDPVKMGLTGVSKVEQGRKGIGREATMTPLQHSTTSTSLNTMGSSKSAPPIVTNVDGVKDDKVLYPFKVKHLGKENYILYAHSAKERDDWCGRIIEAKTKHAQSLFDQNAEPFKMKVIADTAFAYEGMPAIRNSVTIKGTPLDRAIREVEKMYVNAGRPGPVCRARVNCATSFLDPTKKSMIAIGTDYGVYIAEEGSPRNWHKVIPNVKVSQIAVIEDFSIFLLISDKSLIAYHLDIVCPANGVGANNDSNRRAPQKLSGNRDVGFFATARMKDRTLVFYKKKDVSSSTFKVMTVLEPVLQRSTEKKSRFAPLRSGKTEFFRDFDDFYIPTDCIGMNVFHSSVSVSTVKGFEILNLDRKQPMSIPTDIEAPHTATIAQRIKDQRPRGMFRLSDQEFLLCFETCAVYVNKHGDINRSAILEFVGRANSTALFGPYVLLFDNDFVEIRNAMNGRLQQVITGRDVKCLDNGEVDAGNGRRSVKISMMHPENEKNQIVVELVLNDTSRAPGA